MHIEPLHATHASEYRALMLEAYVQAADAFTSTAEDRQAELLDWWVRRIGSPQGLTQSFGAFDAGRLVGTVALECTAKPKTRHAALLIGMYVTAASRGQGAGEQLLQAAIAAARARPDLLALRLTVTEGNAPALRLYQRAGFVAWGTEPQAIRTPGGFRGKVHMSLPLRPIAGPA